jgi:hypothetical protein
MIGRAVLSCATALALSPVPAFPQGTPARQGAPAAPPPAVKVGQKAPDFTLPYLVAKPDGGVETREVSLVPFAGKQNVVLAFFPAAFSPG